MTVAAGLDPQAYIASGIWIQFSGAAQRLIPDHPVQLSLISRTELMLVFLQSKLPAILFFTIAITAWLFLRSKATKLDSTSDFDRKVGQGTLVLEFFSNG
ncbi:MAG: hypothetical protein WAO83_17485 [Fuerstiella sp.]